jgi:hypothetical protein
MTYEPPTVTEIGSLRDLTQQQNNKIGTTNDRFSTPQNGLVGSVTQI